MSLPLQFKDFDPRRSKQNSSYISRLIWQNTGVTCLIGLLVLPVVLGLAIGYLIVLMGVTGFRRITRAKHDNHMEEYQRIKVVLGEELIGSSFPDTVSLNVQDAGHTNNLPPKYYHHRPSNASNHNGYVKTYAPRESLDSEDDKTHAPNTEYRSAEDSGSSTHASMEDNIDKLDDDEYKSKKSRQRRTTAHNKMNIYESANKTTRTKLNGSFELEDEKLSPTDDLGGDLGRLRFALHYNVAKNELHVNVIKAASLPIHDNREGIHPYVKICLLPQQFCWQRTKIIESSTEPAFNESFVISGFSKERIDDYTLRFCVVNYHDHFKERYGDDVIGDIFFPLSSLNDNKPSFSITKWMNLQQVVSGKLEPENLGEVCVSLCFRPISGRLIVTLTKVRGLPKVDMDRTDPYVKISLYCDGVRLSKANTRVKRKTINPVYNEKFNFNVSSDQISLTTVVLKLVNHYDVTYGGGGSLGQVVLGYNSEGSGQEQWNSMLESPSRHIEKWHKVHKDNMP